MLFSIVIGVGVLVGMCGAAYGRYIYRRARSGAIPQPVIAGRS
jgi:hypothetical protein